ncbi:rab-GTPase-TBC domain-containing protein [Cokeromyces recurvatus]|uniref:rab-GTPase-TBC domain-containing protein n=1 Tax=Cokeromyces recurvatus TaxID=90255 RepID=UPI00221E9624|nr:rab-GTPase-TBC domain-containing protein [Cokeromyces recurvatus]KAI7900309.1 rab-GTPase-TBC domain-containing protein [Cokeromyces recurvatus]
MQVVQTNYLNQNEQVEAYVTNNKQQNNQKPTMISKGGTEMFDKITTFSDDDSACSFYSEEDEKLLTPPLATPEKELQEPYLAKEDDVDWAFWSKVISNYNHFSQSELKSLSIQVQQGIPSALRGAIWPLLANNNNKINSSEESLQNYYIGLLKQESVYEKAITRDLHRTFPHHPFFQSSVGQESLFNIVKAYSIHDPEVGYCQGLQFIAGPLLLNMPEEESFYVLIQLMQQYELRGHYTPQLDLLRQRLFQFDGLLADHLPHIHRHFNEQGVRSNMYASQWFLTLFAYKFPLNVVFRIYDTLFTEGVHCLFRIGLALLSKNQSTILSLDFENLVAYLKDDMLTIYNDNITELLCESNEIKISSKRLDRLAKEYYTQAIKADTEASLIEVMRKKNRTLTEQCKSLEVEGNQVKKEYALVAEELITKKLELARIHDENDALKVQTTELRRMLDCIPEEIEQRVQSDMETLCLKNQALSQKNAQLQDQLADMEALVTEMKLKYAQSESERVALKQKLNDLKKWMESV